MKQINIYSASAGSGKTFSLVVEYLSKLLENPYAYRNILAVTFTNKSTNEMKTRILSTLYGLSTNQSYTKGYLTKLQEKTNKTEQEIRNKSKDILKTILHDYTNFNIETIDSFLQKVLKNLTKEVGVGSRFDLILEESDYLEKAIEKLNNSEELKDYVAELIDKRLEEGNNWNYNKILLELAKDLNKQTIRENLKSQTINTEEILKYAKEQRNIYNTFLKDLHDKIDCFKKDFQVSDFIKKSYINNDYALVKEDSPFYKKHRKKGQEERYDEIVDFFNEGRLKAFIAKLEIDSIYEYILLPYIKLFKEEALKEDNVFVLKDTAGLLAEMIKGNDVSFVYEKIGTRINHVMIDEFQDTSQLSWENFQFIANECSSNQGSTTIFGDLKQSIYRWNEGDWTIMSNLIEENKENIIPLSTNYRTDKNIIDFNNGFFEQLYEKQIFQTKVKQTAKNNEDKGLLRFNFLEKAKDIDVLDKTLEEINYYISKGFNHSDIALLFRSNEKLALTAQYLKAKGISPVSSEAFAFNSSRSINTIIYCLRLINNNEERIAQYLLNIYEQSEETLKNIKSINKDKANLIDIVDEIISICNIDNKDIFISAFYERLIEYCQQKPQQLSLFLKYWSEELKDSTISLDDNQENTTTNDKKIKLLSVHKSKGLEFPIVIIPFFDWQMVNNINKIWIENIDSKSPIRLFRANLSELNKTGDCYYEQTAEFETNEQRLDTYNLMYVAFTRAKHALSTISSKYAKENYCSSDLFLYLNSNYPMKENGKFIIGNENLSKESQEKEDNKKDIFNHKGENITSRIEETNFSQQAEIKFSLSKQAQDYFDIHQTDSSEEKRNRGIALHNICSKIYEEKDLETLSLSQEDKAVIKQMFTEAKDYKWFDGTYKVLNEKEIISNGEVKRIDRIMFGKDEVIILDYKFTEDTENEEKYHKQLKEYKKIVSQMGYKNIKTYLWFIGIKIEEVK
ncbi:MAG: UvrD-helicase domain-containing protein [Bacteroidales bacterium]|nr:UvrD-helicase domain-containing protein [Bacteroidales bacterium]MBQ5872757.1 UvrD-helicase domain-containing protein [Bacteroidales bacterium]